MFVPTEIIVPWHTEVKYQSSLAFTIQKFKQVLRLKKKQTKLHGQTKGQNVGTHGKVLAQGTLIKNIEALVFTVQK